VLLVIPFLVLQENDQEAEKRKKDESGEEGGQREVCWFPG